MASKTAVGRTALHATAVTKNAAKSGVKGAGKTLGAAAEVTAATINSVPAAMKNVATRPLASAKSAGKTIANIARNGTVGREAVTRKGNVGVANVATGLVATGLAVPVGAVLGAAKAKKAN
jgi:hypothetical protein